MSQTALEKFQQLLRELFEFDMADLDFGIYRIMNYRRAIIERFINDDLPEVIAAELALGVLAGQVRAVQDLEAASKKVLESLGEDVLDADGNLAAQYQNTRAGKEYLAARERARAAKGSEALEAAVYNHLYAFFSRYWQDGDFISKRRYSKKERYAIPYNGEEVMLYWANHDQYYIKTGEYFTDYTWKAPYSVTVRFKLQAADVEQNNVKGEKRFFLPLTDQLAWDAETRTLTIPFHFRPLTAQEAINYGSKNQQEAIIAKALEVIPMKLSAKEKAEALAALLTEKRRADGSTVSLLEHHLGQYTRPNTSDFFIHKDLRGFLSRELDFYLKNEVLNLDEMESAGEELAEGWFQLLRLIKRVGGHIIEFLAQIEDFQKMLWEKKKFITETFYVITAGNIPEAFYPEIAACEAQWEEWRELLGVDAPDNDMEKQAFLKSQPALPLDTRHFSPDFTDRLLASFDNLDEMTDGLLVHSENWQALNLLQEKYRERVMCIYIDPPYNTGSDEFLYRDAYQHSSWLAMMENRLRFSSNLLNLGGSIFISNDDSEQSALKGCLDFVFGPENFVTQIIWQKKYSPQNDAKYLSDNHDYITLFARQKKSWRRNLLPRTEEANARYENPDNDPRGLWKPSGLDVKTYSPEYDYPITTPSGRVVNPPRGRCWRTGKERLQELIADNRIWFGPDGNSVPALKRFLSEVQEGMVPLTIWTTYQEVGHNQEAIQHLKAIMGEFGDVFQTPKPARLLQRCLQIGANSNSTILDYFAGSGTTGHAVINLNREDASPGSAQAASPGSAQAAGRRKFILVEMAHYFDTVLLPRIKKVTFSPEWKDGRPKRMATPEEFERGPRIVKVIRLESYEDALNNLSFDEESRQKALQLEDYLLQYMLKWETRKSETLLNVEKLREPFSYKLHIHRDGETREQPVDLPETFNYLIGLDVEKRQVLDDAGRRYLVYRGTTRYGRRTAALRLGQRTIFAKGPGCSPPRRGPRFCRRNRGSAQRRFRHSSAGGFVGQGAGAGKHSDRFA